MPRQNQAWILNTLLGVGGIDVLHPTALGLFLLMGHDHFDYLKVSSRIRSRAMIPKAWTTVAGEVERKARHAEERGYRLAARDLFLRAALLYGRGQYSIYRDDPKKTAFHARMVSCYRKVMQYHPTPIERVEIPFENKTIYAVLHLPNRTGKVPCAIFVPGMDNIKEEWHTIAQNFFIPRGMAALAMDGPGQGESLLHHLKVTPDNYERAARAVIDYAVSRPEIDPEKIVVFGLSMGSHWASRVAAHDERVKAVATGMGVYGTTEVIFNQAQPNFKANFMYMTGITEEGEFDEKIAKKMHLRDVAPRIKCPSLMMHGEFDELCPVEDALATYALVRPPKEIWVFENEFHPLGNVAAEMLSWGADWLLQMLDGKYDPAMDRGVYVGKDGNYYDGTAKPTWWPV